MVIPSKTAPLKVLIIGSRGFTGRYLSDSLAAQGHAVYGLIQADDKKPANKYEYTADITQYDEILAVLDALKPDYIIHLAAISFVAHQHLEEMYKVNLFGTLNILQALVELKLSPKKILIASSANIYGNSSVEVVDENCCPLPVNHYANSKLAMENMVRTYFDKLPVLIARPFNYTGVGQRENFLVPKIIAHYQRAERRIELGNLDVIRDFSDVRFVVKAYQQLLTIKGDSMVVNVCSGVGYSIRAILDFMDTLAGYQMEVSVNPQLVRANEVKKLIGSNKLLFELIGKQEVIHLFDTLKAMYMRNREHIG